MKKSAVGAALASLVQAIAAHPEKARARHGSATATIDSGLTCRVIGPTGEMIKTDMPRAMGRAGASPNPGWFFRASFASCLATVIAMRAAQLAIDLSKVEVIVESEGDHRGILGLDEGVTAGALSLRTVVKVGASNASPEQLCELN